MPSLIFTLIFINIASWSIISDFHQQQPFVSFLDIGQGNSILISNPRTTFLYDAGPNGFKTIGEINKLLPFYKKRIDILILSHPDKDHYEGSFEILKKYNVSAIIIPPIHSEESGWLELLNLAKNKNIPIITLKKSDKIQTPFENFSILNPSTYTIKTLKKDNENSLVIKFSQNNNKTFLLTGDITTKTENYLTNKFALKSDYLLIPHHGSKYSSSENFIKAIMPSLAIVQVGKNSYGHPNKETLQRLKKIGVKYWRTDLNGNLLIR